MADQAKKDASEQQSLKHSESGTSSNMSFDHRERSLSGTGNTLLWERRRTLSTSSGGPQGRIALLAIDPSENAHMAFEWYLDNLHRPEDYLLLVHCPEAPRLPTFSFKSGIGPPVEEWKKILDEMNDRTKRLEEDYEGTCIGKKLRYKVRGEAMKNPGEGIIRIAAEEKADMIVMGTRGLSGIQRAILGSVSDYVCRNTDIPVIIIPGKKLQKRRESEAAAHAAQAH